MVKMAQRVPVLHINPRNQLWPIPSSTLQEEEANEFKTLVLNSGGKSEQIPYMAFPDRYTAKINAIFLPKYDLGATLPKKNY